MDDAYKNKLNEFCDCYKTKIASIQCDIDKLNSEVMLLNNENDLLIRCLSPLERAKERITGEEEYNYGRYVLGPIRNRMKQIDIQIKEINVKQKELTDQKGPYLIAMSVLEREHL